MIIGSFLDGNHQAPIGRLTYSLVRYILVVLFIDRLD